MNDILYTKKKIKYAITSHLKVVKYLVKDAFTLKRFKYFALVFN